MKHMENKQTAVEWLKKIILSGNGRLHLTDEEFEQAKQMEKEQIKVSYETGWVNGDLKKAPRFGKDYYDETYNK